MLRLLLATRNADKIKEIAAAIQGLPFELVPASEYKGLPEIDEDQDTLQANALKKAMTLSRLAGLIALADDTGLEVDALGGAPGVYSSRYSGPNATYDDNVNKLLQVMQGVPPDQRSARFRCVIAIARQEHYTTVEGVCEGMIATERHGTEGFGYDPVFWVPSLGKTFAELSLEEKNRISHRGLALQRARTILQKILLES